MDIDYTPAKYSLPSKYILYGIENETSKQIKVGVFNTEFCIYFDRRDHDSPELIELELSGLINWDGLQLFPETSYNFFGYNKNPISVWKIVLTCIKQMNPVRGAINRFDSTRQIYDVQSDEFVQFYKQVGIESFISIGGDYAKELERPSPSIECNFSDIEAVSISNILPIRVISIDIECLSSGANSSQFPNADEDGDVIIQIGASFAIFTTCMGPISSVIFCLGETSPIESAQVISCRDERELLSKFIDYLGRMSPDIITGYYILKFDLDYIWKRLGRLRMQSYTKNASRNNQPWYVRQVRQGSKQTTISEVMRIKSPGVIFFDMFMYMQKNFKLRKYSLNFVCEHFFKETKFDMPYDDIPILFRAGPDERAKIAEYCVQDCVLVLKLMAQREALLTNVMYSRVAGVPLRYIIERGEQIRIMTMIEREIKNRFIIPEVERLDADGGYQGATVIEPNCGLYEEPIVTLDFASLYPSIMIAHNLCYSTLILSGDDYTDENVFHTPAGSKFIRHELREGILPTILKRLIRGRKEVRGKMKGETDPAKLAILNGHQLALKVSANSIYGFTGAISTSRLPCVEISSSVTGYGRQLLETSREIIERRPTSKVIYGDTDSVMIKDQNVTTIEEAIELGTHLSKIITEEIGRSPISLEFEKVFCPYLLINKKRYAGVHWTRPEKHDKIDVKGIEIVRRDNCLFANSILRRSLDIIMLEPPLTKESVLFGFLEDKLCALYDRWKSNEPIDNLIDIGEFIISKTFKTLNYKTPQPHGEIVRRRIAANPHAPLPIGERIEYVICENVASNKSAMSSKLFECAYTVEEMNGDENLRLDLVYYLNKQIFTPLERFLGKTYIDVAKLKERFALGKKKPTVRKENKITNYFSKKK